MVFFRNAILQRAICFIFLSAALLSHTQLLFACESMQGEPKMVCCCGDSMPDDTCPMSESCGMRHDSHQDTCCEVSQQALTDLAVTDASATVETLTLVLDGPQPPPLFDRRETTVFPQPLFFAIFPHEPLPASGDGQIYLRTLRIRL
ncbi:hypothetical protein [Methylomarinum vadi]|uniref:hypothetical protein n=1 Tax=Methylomarinum vadi TaxID=438855 RepID=UPI000690E6DE|nr:hypothetical protein [Methylomarinum vadi]